MPFYNFLPTNFLYMSTTRLQYRLCVVSDQNGVVQDYAFDKHSEKHKTVLSGFIDWTKLVALYGGFKPNLRYF